MRALADELRESPHLSVIHHGHLLVLAQAESPALVRISVAIGGRFSLLNTVSGRVLLAHHQPAQVEAILQLTDEYGAWSLDQRAALGERLARIRMQGYDYASGEINDGVHDLGVLVGTERSQIQAALTIPSLARHPEAFLDATLPALQRCAETITQAAGIISRT